jgi:hypothetical protein
MNLFKGITLSASLRLRAASAESENIKDQSSHPSQDGWLFCFHLPSLSSTQLVVEAKRSRRRIAKGTPAVIARSR